MYTYVMTVILPAGVARAECTAFVRLCDLVWCIEAAASSRASADALRNRTNAFLDACEAAGWQEYMTPKFHWLVHFPRHLIKFGCLMSCFVHERKHRVPKRFCNDMRQLAASERSVLSEVTCLQLANLRSTNVFDFSPHLVCPRAAPKKMHAFLEEKLGQRLPRDSTTTALSARVSTLSTCQSRDIVLLSVANGGKACGEVWFHAAVNGTMVSLVSIWDTPCYDDRLGVLTVHPTDDDLQLVHTTDIITAMAGRLPSFRTITTTIRACRLQATVRFAHVQL
jgi:hypothetical protein